MSVSNNRVESFITAIEILKKQDGIKLEDLLSNPEKSQQQIRFAFATANDETTTYSPDKAISKNDVMALFAPESKNDEVEDIFAEIKIEDMLADEDTLQKALVAWKRSEDKDRTETDDYRKQYAGPQEQYEVASGLVDDMQDSFKGALAEFFSWFEKIFTNLAEEFLASNVRYDFTNTSDNKFRSWVSEKINRTGFQVLKNFCYFLNWLNYVEDEEKTGYPKSLLDKTTLGQIKIGDIMRSFHGGKQF